MGLVRLGSIPERGRFDRRLQPRADAGRHHKPLGPAYELCEVLVLCGGHWQRHGDAVLTGPPAAGLRLEEAVCGAEEAAHGQKRYHCPDGAFRHHRAHDASRRLLYHSHALAPEEP